MEPDWELIEKIQSIAKGEAPDVEQDIPEAPNLELLEHENKSKKLDEDQSKSLKKRLKKQVSLKRIKMAKLHSLKLMKPSSRLILFQVLRMNGQKKIPKQLMRMNGAFLGNNSW